MKHAVKKHNKLLALFLALALLISAVPMGIAFAEDAVYPVVVDSTFAGDAGDLVDYDAAGYTAADLATYATLTEAMTALGTNGGTVWIKGTYVLSSASELAGVEGRSLVVVQGFNASSTNNILDMHAKLTSNNNNYAFPLKGNVTFEHLTIKAYVQSQRIIQTGVYTSGYTMTFGTGVVTANNNLRLTTHYTNSANNNPNSVWENDIVFNSGTAQDAAPAQAQFPGPYGVTTNADIRITLGGTGVIQTVYTQPLAALNQIASGTNYSRGLDLNGNFEFNMNGGTVNSFYIGTYVMNDATAVKGNTLVNINEGNVATINVGHASVYTKGSGTTPDGPMTFPQIHRSGNVALVLNAKKTTQTTVKGNDNAQYMAFAANKKFIIITNNAQGGNVTVDTSNEYFANLLNYNIKVTNGQAMPVYNESNILVGFKVTSDQADAPIYIDGEAATPIEGTTDVYAIEEKGAVVIDINIEVDYSHAVVDATYEGEDGAFVDYSDVITVDGVKSSLPTFKTLTAAMSAMGAEGGKVWIKGTFIPKSDADVEASSAITTRKEVIIEGFNATSNGNAINFDKRGGSYTDYQTSASLAKKGDLTFKNIQVLVNDQYNSGDQYRGAGFYSNGNVLTFGEGVVLGKGNGATGSFAGGRLGHRYAGTNIINVEAGKFYVAAPMLTQFSSTTVTANTTYNISGGEVNSVYGAPNQHGATGALSNYWVNKGEYTVNVTGGLVTDMYIGSYYHTMPSVSQGNLIYNIEGGDVKNVYFGYYANERNSGLTYDHKNYTAYLNQGQENEQSKLFAETGNVAVIINASKDKITTVTSNGYDWFRKGADKTFVVIANNAEGGKADIKTSNAGLAALLDYYIAVYGGEARPVYEGTGVESVLVGFTLEGAEGYVPYIDGAVINKAEGKDYYVLEAKGQEQIRIDFLDPNADAFLVGEKRFDNLANAIASLGAEGGTIYVKGEFSADNLASATKVAHGLVTIKGYGDSAEGNVLTVANMKATIYGDITFEDITLKIASKPIISGTSTITLGKGTVANTIQMGNGSSSGANNVVIDSEYVSMSDDGFATVLTAGNSNLNYNSYITINKGNFVSTKTTGIVLGVYANDTGDASIINGDQYFTINGGTFSDIWLGHRGGGAGAKKAVVKGNTVVTVNGGTFTGEYQLSFDSIGVPSEMHNIAYIFNNKNLTHLEKGINVGDNGAVSLTHFNENSKWIIVSNNAEINKASVTPRVIDELDYMIYVYGGAAQPIFSDRTDAADASTSVLTGFAITADAENAGKLVVVNGTDVLTAVNGVYDLSAYEDMGKLHITFVDAKEMSSTTDELTGQELADLKQSGDVPEKDGYLFAGYYAEGSDKAMTETEFKNADSVIAKFIPKAVLGVAWQIAKGEGNTANLRLISSVDSLQYQKVIFILKAEGRDDMVMESSTVYESIKGNVNGQEVVYDDPTIFSSVSGYFMTHIVSGIPDTFHGAELKVTANLVTKDGKIIPGDEVPIIIKKANDYEAIFGTANQ